MSCLRPVLAFLFLGAALLVPAVPADAGSTVTISAAGNGTYLLQGTGVEGAAAFEITVFYDRAALADPQVVQGELVSGALMAVNAQIPGTVRLALIRATPVTGSGIIATIRFAERNGTDAAITSLTVRLASISGAPLPVSALVVDTVPAGSTAGSDPAPSLPAPASPAGSPGTAATAVVRPSSPSITSIPLLVPGPAGRRDEERTARPSSSSEPEADSQTVQEQVATARRPDPAPDSRQATTGEETRGRKIYSQKSVLERFTEYTGERNARSFVALFEQESMIGFRQEPAVALSDGTSPVHVSFIGPPGTTLSSDVAVMGARLLSLERDPDNTNTWIAVLLPQRGTWEATLTIVQSDLMLVYPLTIVPAAKAGSRSADAQTLSELDRLISRQEQKGVPAYDLNGDGKQDPIDDYILTAQYLLTRQHQARPSRP